VDIYIGQNYTRFDHRKQGQQELPSLELEKV